MAKKRSGLLRRPNTITGLNTPKAFRPQQARQLIRRFHVLQKNQHALLAKIGKLSKENVTLANYKAKFASKKAYSSSYNAFSLPEKTEPLKTEDLHSLEELLSLLAQVDAEIDARGGLNAYQLASTQGQHGHRGGDSSKKLVEWLRSDKLRYRALLKGNSGFNALEIGCLSPENLISTSGIFSSVTKIDLHSQNPLIVEQDFMERKLPQNDSEKFHLVSCLLVLNFVPLPGQRGEMLRRITSFLKSPEETSLSCLFLVLPLPCVSNSRYFDNASLEKIMKSLGFSQVCYYEAKKVAYWLYDWTGKTSKADKTSGRKKELYLGPTRNNFCILLR